MLKKYSDINEIIFILEHLRAEDKTELLYSSGKNWKNNILLNLADKEFLILYGLDNKSKYVPIAMGGFYETNKDNPYIACVWLLCTYFINLNKTLLIKELKNSIYKAQKKYSIMYNFIYKSNNNSKQWLRKLGFRFDNPQPEGIELQEGFEFFYKVSERD